MADNSRLVVSSTTPTPFGIKCAKTKRSSQPFKADVIVYRLILLSSKSMIKFCLLAMFAVIFVGCLGTQTFVEPRYHLVGYKDITPALNPTPIKLLVVAQSNGSENPKASVFWTQQVTRVLKKSRVFEPTLADFQGELIITVNNLGSRGTAVAKGAVTGLTLGAIGSNVTDRFIMNVEFHDASGQIFSKRYEHAIYTTVGNSTPPPGLAPLGLGEALAAVSDDLVLHFIKDLQTSVPNGLEVLPAVRSSP
jgi:hypothetical protein